MGGGHAAAHRNPEPEHEAEHAPSPQPQTSVLARAGDAAIAHMLADDQPKRSGIELCKSPAELGPLKPFIDHWWLRGADFEAGMGPRGGGVPGLKGAGFPKTPLGPNPEPVDAGVAP